MELIFQRSIGKSEHNTYVSVTLYKLGRDFLLTILGGDKHIGAIALSDKSGNTKHHITLPHHKEGDLVNEALKELGNIPDNELLIIGGIHYDHITPAQIEEILKNGMSLIQELKTFLLSR